ncbi:MAG TPA: polyphenol oxidase family protein [Solirubrobacteraceae bacterium]
MNLEPPFYAWHDHIAVDLRPARAVFTTRRGGFSKGPYESLNLGRLTGDRPQSVLRNRQALQTRVGAQLAYIRQVHGARVRRLSAPPEPLSDDPDVQTVFPEADGHATALRGLAPMVLVADCVPIVISGRVAVAVLHCGWRGLAGGVIGEGVRAVRELGDEGSLAAAIGPGAGPCCYEVGEEVHAAFAEHAPAVHVGRNLDLKSVAWEQLMRAGVNEIHDVQICTICAETSIFFSHRRDKGITGRQAGLAWLS